MSGRNRQESEGAESSLAKAIRLLDLVAARNATGVNLSTLARQAKLNTATTRRLLKGLVDGGLLTFDPYAKTYNLGIHLFSLANAAGSPQAFEDVVRRLRAPAEETAASTGDTTYLSVRYGDEALCVDVVPGTYPISTNTLSVGARRPLGVGAGSAALLAALPKSECNRVIAENEEAYDRYGELSVTAVRRLVRQWEKNRFVVNNSLIIPDVSAVGVAVFDTAGELMAALSVSTIKSRLKAQRRKEIVETMNRALARSGYST